MASEVDSHEHGSAEDSHEHGPTTDPTGPVAGITHGTTHGAAQGTQGTGPGTTQQETGSKPAPGDLALVQAFVNTLDVESGRDELADPDRAALWLERHGLLAGTAPLDQEELSGLLELREALRALLLANNGEEADGTAIATLNRITGDGLLTLRFDPGGQAHLEPLGGGTRGAAGLLLGISYRAMVEGTWQRLKACRSHTCQWAFYDHSKNRSGTWCSMAVCGSRNKARAYRSRQAGSS